MGGRVRAKIKLEFEGFGLSWRKGSLLMVSHIIIIYNLNCIKIKQNRLQFATIYKL